LSVDAVQVSEMLELVELAFASPAGTLGAVVSTIGVVTPNEVDCGSGCRLGTPCTR
jgi:hypothetical protein